MSGAPRKSHAVLDLDSRRSKAVKIERMLDLPSREGIFDLLEIGTGSGGIAYYFGTHPTLSANVTAVDVIDNRQLSDGYRFELVHGTRVPFADHSFDIVITNHVIEHVGDRAAQLDHLREVLRLLRSGGLVYLAVPNRWQLVEPHYRLAFLSWWPASWRSAYLRLMRKGDYYDCEPLSAGALERLLDEAGFCFESVGARALYETLEIEPHAFPVVRLLKHVPRGLIAALRRALPTHIYLLRPR